MGTATPVAAQQQDEQRRALDIARALASRGVPIFLAPHVGESGRGVVAGYRLPGGWQHTTADPTVLDGWRPGMAVCAVMGHVLDVIDVDPRNGGNGTLAELSATGLVPGVIVATADTPSGGSHGFVNRLGVRSLDGFRPGVDIKAGTNGEGHGFVFLAPTVKASKVTGELAAYRWTNIDLTRIDRDDLSGAALAEAIAAHRQEKSAEQRPQAPQGADDGPAWVDLDEQTQQRVAAYLERIVTDETAELEQVARWPENQRDAHGRGWEKIIADLAHRLGSLERAAWTPPTWSGLAALQQVVPAPMAAAVDPTHKYREQRDRGTPAPFPAALAQPRITLDVMAGGSLPAVATGALQQVNPSMFVDRDGLRARQLFEHVIAQGPVTTSPDGEVWTCGHGVWRPGEREVRRRIARALGDRYRKAHAETVLDLIRAQEPQITDRAEARFLNFRNGMLDLQTGDLGAHDPSHYSTNQLAVDWRPEATCPQILEWLAQVLPDPTERTVWLELVGYAAYGDNPLHKAALLDGGGRNGKGTTLRIITALLGRENVAAVPPQKLDSDRWAAADLFGVLANLAGDVSPRSFTETETFKQVTGGDLIRAERKHRDAFKFVSRAFLIGSFNRLPTSADHSEGFFSRWVVLPFRAQIAEPDEHGNVPAGTIRKDASVEDRLLTPAELEGLAVLAVGALRALLVRGAFTETSAGREAAQEFRRHADPLRGFLAEAVSPAPSCHIARTDLYKAYLRWCGENQIKARGRNNFNADLRALHVETFGFPVDERKTNGVEVWSGLELAASYYRQSGAGP